MQILPFFGGYISDLLGVKLMGVVFISLITLGQFIVSIGISCKNENVAWGVMWAGEVLANLNTLNYHVYNHFIPSNDPGRVVFGFGGESLSVVQSAFVASYFQGKELAFAMGACFIYKRCYEL
jgi:MFS family permease